MRSKSNLTCFSRSAHLIILPSFTVLSSVVEFLAEFLADFVAGDDNVELLLTVELALLTVELVYVTLESVFAKETVEFVFT